MQIQAHTALRSYNYGLGQALIRLILFIAKILCR